MIVTAKANMQLQDQGRVFEVCATPEFCNKHPSLITCCSSQILSIIQASATKGPFD